MKSILKVVTLASLTLLVASPSFAQKTFAEKHPRRAEVLRRDGNLNKRINNKEGDLHGHYGQLKSEDRAIHHQERVDAHTDGGHITKTEQNQINHEENHVNRQIHKDQQ